MPQALRLDKVIEQVISDNQYGIESGSITMELETVPVEISGDAEQLRVIFDNLLSNAINYSPSGESIIIRFYIEDNQAVVEVIDHGLGIVKSEREKIFDAFYQGSNRPQGTARGNGLGLAIVREYLDMNRGSITVLPSEQGAIFRVCIAL